jgi:hypothetical protein
MARFMRVVAGTSPTGCKCATTSGRWPVNTRFSPARAANANRRAIGIAIALHQERMLIKVGTLGTTLLRGSDNRRNGHFVKI